MKSKTLLVVCSFFTSALMAQTLAPKQLVTGSSDYDGMASMYQTADGGFVAAAASSGGISKNKTSPNFGRSDYWLVKYDSTGKKLWDKTYGGIYDDYLTLMIPAKDGGFLLGGFLLGGYSLSGISGTKTEANRGNFDYWIVKVDSAGTVQWDKTYGGDNDDEMLAVTQTLDGGYMLGGYSPSNISGDKSQNSKGYWDFWIIKIDAGGAKQWDKTIGGDYDDIVLQIKQSADSSYLLGGYSNSNVSGNKTEPSRGTSQLTDLWLVKINSKGNVQWDKTIGGSESEYLYSMDVTKDGGYILGAMSSSDISFDKTVPSRGAGTALYSYDYWLVKVTRTGDIQWQSVAGGNDEDDLYYITQTLDGGYIAGGVSYSPLSADKTEAQIGKGDAWIVKFNNTGAIQWDKSLGGTLVDYAGLHSIIELSPNRFQIGMTSASGISGNKTIGSRGQEDMWFVILQGKTTSFTAGSGDKVTVPFVKMADETSLVVMPNPVKSVMHVQTNAPATVSLVSFSGRTLFTQTINGKADIDVSRFPSGMYYLVNQTAGTTKRVIINR